MLLPMLVAFEETSLTLRAAVVIGSGDDIQTLYIRLTVNCSITKRTKLLLPVSSI